MGWSSPTYQSFFKGHKWTNPMQIKGINVEKIGGTTNSNLIGPQHYHSIFPPMGS